MNALITASYSAIGQALTRQLLHRGYRVIALNRDDEKTVQQRQQVQTELPNAEFHEVIVDLGNPADIRRAIQQVYSSYESIDVLINNAGFAGDNSVELAHGVEQHFQINTLAPLQLLEQLPLHKQSLVVNLGSSAMQMVNKLQWDPQWHREHFKKMSGPYAHSKLALATLMQKESQRDVHRQRTLLTIDPGPTKSAMSLSAAMPGWVRLLRPLFRSPESTAAKLLQIAFTPEQVSGSYLQGGKIKPIPSRSQNSDLFQWHQQMRSTWA